MSALRACVGSGNANACCWYFLNKDNSQTICEFCAKHAFLENEVSSKHAKLQLDELKCAMSLNSFHMHINSRLYLRHMGLRINAHHIIQNEGIKRPAPKFPGINIPGVFYLLLPINTLWSISLALDEYGMYKDQTCWLRYELRNEDNDIVDSVIDLIRQDMEFTESICISPQTIYASVIQDCYWLTVDVFQSNQLTSFTLPANTKLFHHIDSIKICIKLCCVV